MTRKSARQLTAETSTGKSLGAAPAAHLDLGSHRVFFFGSRVQGTNSERSDIDIGVEGPREVPAEAIIAIREELDNLPTLYTFDVVDFRKVSPGFGEETLNEVE